MEKMADSEKSRKGCIVALRSGLGHSSYILKRELNGYCFKYGSKSCPPQHNYRNNNSPLSIDFSMSRRFSSSSTKKMLPLKEFSIFFRPSHSPSHILLKEKLTWNPSRGSNKSLEETAGHFPKNSGIISKTVANIRTRKGGHPTEFAEVIALDRIPFFSRDRDADS